MTTLRPAAFVDRDGTINVERHYLGNPDELELIPGVAVGLKDLQRQGFVLVVLTNQSGVARRYFTLDAVAAVHARLAEMLAAEGVTLDAVYICPHGPADACDCRKPKPGMALKAAADLGLDLGRSVMIGDKAVDLGLGRAIGARTVLVRTGHGLAEEASAAPLADFVADDLATAARWVAQHPA